MSGFFVEYRLFQEVADMFFQWEDLIYISIGHDLFQAYTPRDTRSIFDILVGIAPPKQGSEIIPKIEELRSIMNAEGINLPKVSVDANFRWQYKDLVACL